MTLASTDCLSRTSPTSSRSVSGSPSPCSRPPTATRSSCRRELDGSLVVDLEGRLPLLRASAAVDIELFERWRPVRRPPPRLPYSVGRRIAPGAIGTSRRPRRAGLRRVPLRAPPPGAGYRARRSIRQLLRGLLRPDVRRGDARALRGHLAARLLRSLPRPARGGRVRGLPPAHALWLADEKPDCAALACIERRHRHDGRTVRSRSAAMTAIPASFRAFVAAREGEAIVRGVRPFAAADLPAGEVEIRVGWSSVNFKDALATIPNGKVARIDPLIPGIDLAGEVVASADPSIPVGSAVLAHGYELGVSRHGGYAEYARVPAGWVVPLPEGLDARLAMAIGTAGFTAAMSVVALESRGLVAGRRAGARDGRVGRGRLDGDRDPRRPRARGLGGDRQGRRGRAAARSRGGGGPRSRRGRRAEREAARVGALGRRGRLRRRRDAAVHPADAAARRDRGGIRQHRRARASRRPSSRSSCARSRSSGSTRRTWRSRSAGRSGRASPATSARAAWAKG